MKSYKIISFEYYNTFLKSYETYKDLKSTIIYL